MCGRYGLTRDVDELDARLRLPVPREASQRYNIAPTEDVLTVVAPKGERLAEMMRWDLVPSFWSKPLKGKPPMFNARMEDVLRRDAYRRLVPRGDRRALLIADGYYEWLKPEKRGEPRQPFWFQVDAGAIFAFAGLWTPAKVGGQWLHSCTLLTCSSALNRVAAAIHDRMPVILADEDSQVAWLDGSLDARAALELCGPLPASRLSSKAANPAVNKAGTDGGRWLLDAPG